MSTLIQFKELYKDKDAIMPKRGYGTAAAFDLFALEDVEFKPGEIKLVKTGWACQVEEGYRANIYVRSSTPLKKGFILANGVGVIDNDYRGELLVQLMNVKNEPHIIHRRHRLGKGMSVGYKDETVIPIKNKVKKGDAIAQLEVVQNLDVIYELVDELSDTQRGEGGFGSTGV